MKTSIIREDNQPNYCIEHLLEAFNDIHSLVCRVHPFFENVSFGYTTEGQPALRYTVTATECEIIKLFNADQGQPELISDITAYLFSMLDAAANC